MISSYSFQKLTVTYIYQIGSTVDTNQMDNLKLGSIMFSFDRNLIKIYQVDLNKLTIQIPRQKLFYFRDPNLKTKIGYTDYIQKYIELHIKDSQGKFNATTGIQSDLMSYISGEMEHEYDNNHKQTDYYTYKYTFDKSPVRESVVLSKGSTNFTAYFTSQENDYLDLTQAEYILIEFDVYYSS